MAFPSNPTFHHTQINYPPTWDIQAAPYFTSQGGRDPNYLGGGAGDLNFGSAAVPCANMYPAHFSGVAVNPDDHIIEQSCDLDWMPLVDVPSVPAAEEPPPHDIGGGGELQGYDFTVDDYLDWTMMPADDIGGGGEAEAEAEAEEEESPHDNDIAVGFRFQPSDEEVITDFLRARLVDGRSPSSTASGIIKHADIYAHHPQQLSDMEVRHEYEDGKMYYYTQIKKMGSNIHRSVKSGEEGYWKPTQSFKPIKNSSSSAIIGSKTPLVFYHPNKKKTNWHMYEYKLPQSYYHNHSSSHQHHLVLAVIYQHPLPPPPPNSQLSIMAAGSIV